MDVKELMHESETRVCKCCVATTAKKPPKIRKFIYYIKREWLYLF